MGISGVIQCEGGLFYWGVKTSRRRWIAFIYFLVVFLRRLSSTMSFSLSSRYASVVQQPLLANRMAALSAHQPLNVGIAHVVWPQPANKRNRHGQNR